MTRLGPACHRLFLRFFDLSYVLFRSGSFASPIPSLPTRVPSASSAMRILGTTWPFSHPHTCGCANWAGGLGWWCPLSKRGLSAKTRSEFGSGVQIWFQRLGQTGWQSAKVQEPHFGISEFPWSLHLKREVLRFLGPSRLPLPGTVDGQHPAPDDRWFVPGFIGLHASQLVQDFVHPLSLSVPCTLG